MRLINLIAIGIHWFGKLLIVIFIWPFWVLDKSEIEGGAPSDTGALILTVLWFLFLIGLFATWAAR